MDFKIQNDTFYPAVSGHVTGVGEVPYQVSLLYNGNFVWNSPIPLSK